MPATEAVIMTREGSWIVARFWRRGANLVEIVRICMPLGKTYKQRDGWGEKGGKEDGGMGVREGIEDGREERHAIG